jgi:hypothetical protein
MPERIEKRSETRRKPDGVYSVEFSCPGLPFIYEFRIRNLSTKGICILVRDDSEVLKHLRVGDVLEMKYYTTDTSSTWESLKTEIRHITKDEEGRFKNHTLVGLAILEKLVGN